MHAYIPNPKLMFMAETSTLGIFCGRNVCGRNVRAETSMAEMSEHRSVWAYSLREVEYGFS